MAEVVTVTACRGCGWPHGRTPSMAAAGRHAAETGHGVVTETRAACPAAQTCTCTCTPCADGSERHCCRHGTGCHMCEGQGRT